MSRIHRLILASALSIAALVACHSIESARTNDGPAADERIHETMVDTSAVDGESDMPAYEVAELVKLERRKPLESEGLHNVFVLSETIISGSEPSGDAAFEKLREMGVRTILSVDGKIPDAERAERFGMRYVHVPVQYKGIRDGALIRIVKTYRELEGPFYIHCFHGKHRGPAAAAVGRILLDGASPRKAMAEMRQWFGTSSKYDGLYRQILAARFPDATATAALDWDFDPAFRLEGIAGTMIPIPRAHDGLKHLARRGWKVDPEHPDIDPVNEAEILVQSFEAMVGLDEVRNGPERMAREAAESLETARRLLEQLRRLRAGEGTAGSDALDSMKLIKSQCASCHSEYRNN